MIAGAAMFLVVSSLGMLAGMQLHESAHYVVLKVAGRSPKLIPPSLAERRIAARVEFDRPQDHIPVDVRLAAIAPLLAGVLLAIPLLFVGLLWPPFGIGFAVAATITTAKPSRQDLQRALGRRAA